MDQDLKDLVVSHAKKVLEEQLGSDGEVQLDTTPERPVFPVHLEETEKDVDLLCLPRNTIDVCVGRAGLGTRGEVGPGVLDDTVLFPWGVSGPRESGEVSLKDIPSRT